MNPKSKKWLIILLAAAALIVVTIVVLFIFNQARDQAIQEDESRYVGTTEIDPVSGEEVTRTDRDHDTLPGSITFLGFAQLIDRGLTMEQVTNAEDKFKDISDSLGEPFKEVSLYKDSVERILPSQSGNSYHQVNFKVRINQKTDYSATLTYDNISTVDLTITNQETNEKHEA